MKISELYQLFKDSTGVCTDTRKIKKGNLFFALKGPSFNGNDFAKKALELGATHSIVDCNLNQYETNIVVVNDVLKTLQALSTYHRKLYQGKVIALTGSNGKTTTKELLKSVLSQKYLVHATLGNFNNSIGVPLTLLKTPIEVDFLILEMGANHLEEINSLCQFAQPDFGLITNFGKAHLVGFGGIKGVIKGKLELFDYLQNNQKTIFINQDDPIQKKWEQPNLNTWSHSQTKGANCIINNTSFPNQLKLLYKNITISPNLTGLYNFQNIASAISVGAYFKLSAQEIKIGIENYIPKNNRSQLIQTSHHGIIILDAYNANPSSMNAAITNFSNREEVATIAVLGDMFELGDYEDQEHQKIVDLIECSGINQVFLVGEKFYKTSTSKTNISKFKTLESLKPNLLKIISPKSALLIKASRGMALEQIMEWME